MSKQQAHSWWVLAILPGIHIFLVILTVELSATTPGGAYYRIVGVDPVVAGLLMVYEGVFIHLCFLLVGTAWWFGVGLLGWLSRGGRVSAVSRAVVINTLIGLLGIAMVIPVFRRDLVNGVVSLAVGLQYLCAGLLCIGAFVSAAYAWKARNGDIGMTGFNG